MLKALVKKQFAELGSFYFRSKKNGKPKVGKDLILFAALYVLIYLSLAASFAGISALFAHTLLEAGLTWLYFSMLGILAIALSVIINSLSTYSILYTSKDNELLLSMPIPPSKILLSRMISVYAMGLIFESMVMLPGMIVYWSWGFVSPADIILPPVMMIVMSFFVLALICILGFVVAKISVRLKNRSIITTLVSLLLIFGIYYLQFRMNYLLQTLVENAERVSTFIKSYLFPFYHMGLAFEGRAASFVIFFLIAFGLFAVVYALISKSFVSIATDNRGTKKVRYKEKAAKPRSVRQALCAKELSHFAASPAYMLNTGLGIIILSVIAIVSAVKFGFISSTLTGAFAAFPPEVSCLVPILLACAVCLVISMNGVTAPSISLEGNNLWLAQSLPVTAADVFSSKLRAHVILNLVPAVPCIVLLEAAAGAGALCCAAGAALVAAFIFFTGELGLAANIKKPNFDWTNETVPVKQSVSVAVVIFGGFASAAAVGGAGYLLCPAISAPLVLVTAAVVFAAASVIINRWLRTKGAELFENL